MASEDEILEFAGASFRSIWALELLFKMRNGGDRTWRSSEIIKDVRSSPVVATEALDNLIAAGLVVEEDRGSYRYHSGSPAVEELLGELEKLYSVKPTQVIRKIINSPNTKLQILSDAFRLKE